MIIVNIVFVLFIAGLFLCSLKENKEWLSTVDKKKHKLYFLYPMAEWFLTKTGLIKLLLRKTKVSNAVRALNITGKPERLQKLYWYSKTALVFLILFLFNLISILGSLSSTEGQGVLINGQLTRPGYGEGNKEVRLSVEVNNKDKPEASDKNNNSIINGDTENNNTSKEAQGGGEKKNNYTEDITITNNELEYTQEELQKVMQDAMLYIDKEVLGKNESENNIREDLNFISDIPNTGIKVEWNPEDTDLISSQGSVNNENISSEGVVTKVTAVLVYRNTKTEHPMRFTVFPKLMTEKEKLLKELEAEIQNQSDQTSKSKQWKLPGSLGTYSLNWKEKKQDTGTSLFILGIIMAAGIWFLSDKELDSRMKKRKDQMLFDYPEIINKFTLLVNAGMTIKQAWNKISEDYSQKSGENSKNKRYAYEEMLVTVHELKLGIPEENAYEQFGRRAGVLPYIKFSSLIAQNLKKGNKGLTELLGREALEAFEERKDLAKRLGEEAGTKLLGPMMIMLVIVLLIILIPAFMSFKV